VWTWGPDLPQGVSLLGEDLEVLLGQLDGREGLQPQVGPALDELHQRLEGVQAQPVVAIVGQVGHEDADLEVGGGGASRNQQEPGGTSRNQGEEMTSENTASTTTTTTTTTDRTVPPDSSSQVYL